MTKQELMAKRIFNEAMYIIEKQTTVREVARRFGVSKSNVYHDLTKRLYDQYPELATEVQKVLSINKSERHIRGGKATKMKYSQK